MTRITQAFTRALGVVGLWAVGAGLSPAALAAGPEGGRLLGTIRFDVGAELGEKAQKDLLEASKELEGKSDLALFLIGHTDDRGSNASNMTLAGQRAAAVRDWLVGRGIDGASIKTASRGEEEPIEAGTTGRIRALNRRVEIWLAARTAEVSARQESSAAWLSWHHGEVGARARDAADFKPGAPKLPLGRKATVRTSARSAAEVTYRHADRLYLGANGQAVLLVEPDKAKRAQPRPADVALEEGALFVRLAHAEAPMSVGVRGAELRLTSRDARVGRVRDGDATVVSVYEGSAVVAARGKTMTLKAGTGTRIPDRAPPEEASALAPPPTWTTPEGATFAAGAPVDLAWAYADASSAAHLELSRATEDGPERPIEILDAPGTAATLALGPGAHVLRPRAVDRRGIPGPLGGALSVIVLDPPVDLASGKPLPIERGAIRLPRPGSISLAAPAGLLIALGSNPLPPSAVATMAFEAPGSSVLSYRLVRPDGRVVGRGRLDVVVDAPAEVAATASSTAAEDAALDLVYGAPDLAPPAPRGPVTLMAQMTGGARFGGPDPGGMATFWMGATARFTDVVNLDFGPWVAWHHPTLEAADGRNAGVDLFPLHLRAALAFDLGVARPYFGASGGLQFLRLGKSATALGIVADEVQLGWDAFAGVGLAFGPGRFVFEVDYGSIALSGASPAADLGGVAVLGGYRFSD